MFNLPSDLRIGFQFILGVLMFCIIVSASALFNFAARYVKFLCPNVVLAKGIRKRFKLLCFGKIEHC